MAEIVTFRIVPHGSQEYEQTLALRRDVLLAPLGVRSSPDELADEARDTHLTAWRGDLLVACLILTRSNEMSARMRQVAVLEPEQGRGVGRRIVTRAEDLARAEGYRRLCAHAREGVVGFYLKLGYRVIGDPFVEVGIPHREVEKDL